jgi:hypothetical protein
MAGWRLWTVRASHAGAITVLSWRWAATGDGTFGIATGALAVALVVTFLPTRESR